MHTAVVQRLLRDRGAWELAHGYDEVQEAEPEMVPVLRPVAV
jgi:UDP-3-O-[3-hydroxymyristoyl] N-acetylglucosamine deacetylase